MRLTRQTPNHYRPYLLDRRFSARASQEAAVATAAYEVLKNIVSTVPNIASRARATVLATLLSQYNASVDPIPDSPFKTRGIEAGNAAAEAMIAARMNDGRFGDSQWVPMIGVAGTGSPLPGTPTRHRGWVSCSHSSFRARRGSAPTVRLSSAPPSTRRNYNEVKALGSADPLTTTRTVEQTYPPAGGRARPTGCGTPSPGTSSHETASASSTAPASSRCRT